MNDLPIFIFPLISTVILWVSLIMLPVKEPRSAFDVERRIVPIVRFFVGVTGSLTFWLVYYIWKAHAL